MKAPVLKSVMRLFAIVSQVHSIRETAIARGVIGNYLKLIVKSDLVNQSLIMYDFYHSSMREREIKTGKKQLSLFSVKAVIICEEINAHLSRKERIIVLIHILEILSQTGCKELDEIDFIKTIAHSLRIDDLLFNDCFSFVFDRFQEIHYKDRVLFVSKTPPEEGFKHIYREFLNGKIVFMMLRAIDLCIFKQVVSDDQLYLNDQQIELNTISFFNSDDSIKSPLLGEIGYSNILKLFLKEEHHQKLEFMAYQVSHSSAGENAMVEPFNLMEESGQLIGIVGRRGVGKSLLINLLNGSIAPSSGVVLLNGHDIHKEKPAIEGLIGYMPEDDLLMEELSVFQNLYYRACLCFKNDSKEKIYRRIFKVLHSLSIFSIKDQKVGNLKDKTITDLQRKLINLALELIRSPKIIFVDNPVAGLSIDDSEKIINQIKQLSYKGILVFVSLQEPSGHSFKQFDKLILLDKGGRFVYYGQPLRAFDYLKNALQMVHSPGIECLKCGIVRPEDLMQIIEAPGVDDFGDYTAERQISPEDWYQLYTQNQRKEINLSAIKKISLPKAETQNTQPWQQWKIFSLRNIFARISNKQFLWINALEVPLLAIIICWISRYQSGTSTDMAAYSFFGNVNLPMHLFMGVIVAVFIGLMLSAEEIIGHKKILKHEVYLNLNKRSYLHSKLLFLGIVLGIQMLVFVIISSKVLEIKGMLFHFWLQYWLLSLVAAFIGLNISASVTKLISIYILIPLLLLPQLLLGGSMIQFDKLNRYITHQEYVPLIGDLIPTRWAYEALMVHQFKRNDFQSQLYSYDQKVSEIGYYLNYYIPTLQQQLAELKYLAMNPGEFEKLRNKIDLINTEMLKLQNYNSVCIQDFQPIQARQFNISVYSNIEVMLDCVRNYFIQALPEAIDSRDNKIEKIKTLFENPAELLDLKEKHYNEELSAIVLSNDEKQKILVKEHSIIRKAEPIYHMPENRWGRAHFYSPVKRLGNFYIETYWFNFGVLVCMVLILYFALVYDVFFKVASLFQRQRVRGLLTRLISRLSLLVKPIFVAK